ncbi:hypothetical protein CPB84DRAFT_1756584 [Gymnopilus junonius]|uniref:Uncharacterized protein n=1 Tax=Gymnopilus junonius TaxID=109634 RepID=A0A9P5N724_GYMJU|nr:hypothetical protein CPB84DRAFT_1756584 [Gymnopilus junonius]
MPISWLVRFLGPLWTPGICEAVASCLMVQWWTPGGLQPTLIISSCTQGGISESTQISSGVHWSPVYDWTLVESTGVWEESVDEGKDLPNGNTVSPFWPHPVFNYQSPQKYFCASTYWVYGWGSWEIESMQDTVGTVWQHSPRTTTSPLSNIHISVQWLSQIIAMETAAIETLKRVTQVLASEVQSPVILICLENGKLEFNQMAKADFPANVVQAVLSQLVGTTENAVQMEDGIQVNEFTAQPSDDLEEIDVVNDNYDDIANIIDTYDEEEEASDEKEGQVQKMLHSLIDDTAAYLKEQDRLSAAQAEDAKSEGKDEDPVIRLSAGNGDDQPPESQKPISSTQVWVEFKAEHPILPGVHTRVQKNIFKESLVKSLIKEGVITSHKEILDSYNNTSWRENGDRILTDGTPVQASELSALQLLENEQARILQTMPALHSVARSATCPTQKKSSPYARLCSVVFKLFAEDLCLLQEEEIHTKMPHILTNSSQASVLFWDAPFNVMHFWMHGLSVLAKHMPCPNLTWWRGDVILMFGHEISFAEYREKTYKKVLHLEHLILNKVLFGLYTMEEAEELFNIKTIEDAGCGTEWETIAPTNNEDGPKGVIYDQELVWGQSRYMDLGEKKPSDMELMLNNLCGHQKKVGNAHYAHEAHLGSCPPEERERALALGREYHRVMGFVTGFNDELTPDAKKLCKEFSYELPAIRVPVRLGKQKAAESVVPPPLPPAMPKKYKSKGKSYSLSQDPQPSIPQPSVPLRQSTRERIPSKSAQDMRENDQASQMSIHFQTAGNEEKFTWARFVHITWVEAPKVVMWGTLKLPTWHKKVLEEESSKNLCNCEPTSALHPKFTNKKMEISPECTGSSTSILIPNSTLSTLPNLPLATLHNPYQLRDLVYPPLMHLRWHLALVLSCMLGSRRMAVCLVEVAAMSEGASSDLEMFLRESKYL